MSAKNKKSVKILIGSIVILFFAFLMFKIVTIDTSKPRNEIGSNISTNISDSDNIKIPDKITANNSQSELDNLRTEIKKHAVNVNKELLHFWLVYQENKDNNFLITVKTDFDWVKKFNLDPKNMTKDDLPFILQPEIPIEVKLAENNSDFLISLKNNPALKKNNNTFSLIFNPKNKYSENFSFGVINIDEHLLNPSEKRIKGTVDSKKKDVNFVLSPITIVNPVINTMRHGFNELEITVNTPENWLDELGFKNNFSKENFPFVFSEDIPYKASLLDDKKGFSIRINNLDKIKPHATNFIFSLNPKYKLPENYNFGRLILDPKMKKATIFSVSQKSSKKSLPEINFSINLNVQLSLEIKELFNEKLLIEVLFSNSDVMDALIADPNILTNLPLTIDPAFKYQVRWSKKASDKSELTRRWAKLEIEIENLKEIRNSKDSPKIFQIKPNNKFSLPVGLNLSSQMVYAFKEMPEHHYNFFKPAVVDPKRAVANKTTNLTYYAKTLKLLSVEEVANENGWKYFQARFNKKIDFNEFKNITDMLAVTSGKQNKTTDMFLDLTLVENNDPIILDKQLIDYDDEAYKIYFKSKISFLKDKVLSDISVKSFYWTIEKDKQIKIFPADFAISQFISSNIFSLKTDQSESYPWDYYLVLDSKKEFSKKDLEKSLSFKPPLDFTVKSNPDSDSLNIYADFDFNQEYDLLISSGILQQNKEMENLTIPFSAKTFAKNTRLSFANPDSRYLMNTSPLIKIASRNLEAIRLKAWKLHENNIPMLLNIRNHDFRYNTQVKLARQLSKPIFDKISKLSIIDRRLNENLINFNNLLPTEDQNINGIYLLSLDSLKESNANENYYDSEDDYDEDNSYSSYYSLETPVVISDLALTARLNKNNLNIVVNNLSKAQAIAEAWIKVYDLSNQVISEGKTDSNGLFQAQLNNNEASLITVQHQDDLNYLILETRKNYSENQWHDTNASALPNNLAEIDTPSKKYLNNGYEAYIITPRNLFRPDEEISVKALVRGANLSLPQAKFPINWQIFDPNNRNLSQGQAMLNEVGSLDFSTHIPFTARTGKYQIKLFTPGDTEPIGLGDFSVEDFIPPRIKVEAKIAQENYYLLNPDISGQIKAKYLFGAPGNELNYRLDSQLLKSNFTLSGWEKFNFNSDLLDFKNISNAEIITGKLNENGEAHFSHKIEFQTGILPNKVLLVLTAGVADDGGRWTSSKTSTTIYPNPLALGLDISDNINIDQPTTLKVAAILPNGKTIENENLEYTILRIKKRYYRIESYDRLRLNETKETSLIESGNVNIKNSQGQIDFTPNSPGNFIIKLKSNNHDYEISQTFFVQGHLSYSTVKAKTKTEKIEALTITLDKKQYAAGDIAIARIKSPFTGRLWLSVENSKTIYHDFMNMDNNEVEVRIPVSDDFWPNSYITASVVRPVVANQNEHRVIGTKIINMDKERKRLNIRVETADKLTPSSTEIIKIKTSTQDGTLVESDLTLALVDEGVLNLGSFITPDPFTFFNVTRKFQTLLYDFYRLILPVNSVKDTPLLLAGGSDESYLNSLFSPFKRKQEVLSIFKPKLNSISPGEYEVQLDMPEFSGQGRLMIIAAHGGQHYANFSKNITIARDVTTEASLPLVLAPGDKFTFPVRVFISDLAEQNAGNKATLNLKFAGPVNILGQSNFTFDLKPGESELIQIEAIASPKDNNQEQAGIGKLIIESKTGTNISYQQDLETVVRPPFPREIISKSGFINEETDLSLPFDKLLNGTIEAKLSISKGLEAEISKAISYLIDYPYNCLEQTTSKAWIFVASRNILQSLSAEKYFEPEMINRELTKAVQTLSTMQNSNGKFSFWPDNSSTYEWGSVYATHFLTHAAKQITLPSGLKERAIWGLQQYLSTNLDDDNNITYHHDSKAYAAYVLTLNGDYPAGWISYLNDNKKNLSDSGRIFLAGAQALRTGTPEALKQIKRENIKSLREIKSSLESQSRNNSLELIVWNDVAPLNDETKQLALKVAKDGAAGLWRNTQENAMAAFALGTYLDKTDSGVPYEVSLIDKNGQTLLTADEKTSPIFDTLQLRQFQNSFIKLKNNGKGAPYYTYSVTGVPLEAPPPVSNQLVLRRTWELPDGKIIDLNSINDLKEAIVLNKGDRLKINLYVTIEESLQNMILLDLLSGGLEIDNPKLSPTSDDYNNEQSSSFGGDPTRIDLREDRLIIIEPWISGSKYKEKISGQDYEYNAKYSYSAFAATVGEFVIPPTLAEGMYDPEIKALLSSGKLIIK